MRVYELALVFRPAVTEVQRKKLLETVKGWLKPARNASASVAGGDVKIVKEDHWGLKALSYKIKRETSGFFTVLALEAKDTVLPADFEKKLLAQENIIRHLLIRKK